MNNNYFDESFTIKKNMDSYDFSKEINEKGSRLLRKWRDQHPNPYRGDSVYTHYRRSF